MYLKHRKYEAYLSILCWLKKSTKTEKRIETVNKRSCMAFESKKCKFKIRKKQVTQQGGKGLTKK